MGTQYWRTHPTEPLGAGVSSSLYTALTQNGKKVCFVTTLPRFAHTYPYLWGVNKLLTKNEPFK